jgi:Concanavalin A-like lectin/glucanases superfamily
MNNKPSGNLFSSLPSAFSGSKNGPASSNWFIMGISLLIVIGLLYFIYQFQKNVRQFQRDQPYLIKDTMNAQSPIVIQGKALPAPYDGKYGMEFTYAFWMYIDSNAYNNIYVRPGDNSRTNHYFHVFHKGTDNNNPQVCLPAVWLNKKTNELLIDLSVYPYSSVDRPGDYVFTESVSIQNLPMNKWFHVAAVCMEKNLDVYINGFLKVHRTLQGLPKWNYGNAYLCRNGGFNGLLSRVRYFNYAIAPYQVEQLMQLGPSQKPCINTGELPPYLSADYWFTNSQPNSI